MEDILAACFVEAYRAVDHAYCNALCDPEVKDPDKAAFVLARNMVLAGMDDLYGLLGPQDEDGPPKLKLVDQ